MNIVIVGAGEVGTSIAASLADTHRIVVIDVDPDRVESLTYSYDVLAIEGSGTSRAILAEAGIDEADMVIASTDADETNLAICGTAQTFGDPFTIARVKNINYLRTWQHDGEVFDVDYMVCTDLLTAKDVVEVTGLPGSRDVDFFAGEQIEMAEFEIQAESTVANRSVRAADQYESLTFAAVFRDDSFVIPSGDTVIEPGNRVIVIGRPASIREFATDVTADTEAADTNECVVVGGSEIGRHAARLLDDAGYSTTLVEQDPDRARELAEQLPSTLVLEADATDVDVLTEEHVPDADIAVTALENDEQNLLVGLLLKQLGVARTIAIVETPAYVELFETVGIDVALNPREVAAEEIIRLTRERETENVSLIEDDAAEVIELEVDDESVLASRPIQDAMADLPDGIVVGALTRNNEFITPRGDTVVQSGDHVVVFVDATMVDDVLEAL